MQSKDIIIRLIDEKIINGEEAYTLLNDILHDELRQCWENLKSTSDKIDCTRIDLPTWTLHPYTTTSGSGTIACDTSASTYSVKSI